MKTTFSHLFYKICKVYLSITVFILMSSCSQTEMEDDLETGKINETTQQIDPLLIGSWKHQNSPTAISIDSTGAVSYFRQNLITGKFDRDTRFIDKIKAVDGRFQFLESNNCHVPKDSMYVMLNGNLIIPLEKAWQSTPVFFSPIKIDSFVGKKRDVTSFLKADITIKAFWGEKEYQLNSSDKYELIEILSAANPGSFISAEDNPNFNCNLPNRFHHSISMITSRAINAVGVYDLVSSSLQFSGQESTNTYNLSYDNFGSSQLEEGQINITHFSEDAASKHVEGEFEFYMTSEFNHVNDTIWVKNGVFKIKELKK